MSEIDQPQLFSGTNSKDRFSHILCEILSILSPEELQIMANNADDIGTHSLRKGAATYCLGQVMGPSPVTVYIRMGHSLGKLKDKYIFFGEGADQLCGRTLSGLPYSDDRFCYLPPHFENDVLQQLTPQYWQQIVPGYSNYPDSFKTTFPFLLAVLIHNIGYLRSNLNSNHPIFSSRVLTMNPKLSMLAMNVVVTKCHCNGCGMQATGIPPYHAIASNINKMDVRLTAVEDLLSSIKLELTTTYGDNIASKVADYLKNNMIINGALPITRQDFEALRKEIIEACKAMCSSMANPTSTNENSQHMEPNTTSNIQSWWRMFQWDDGLIGHMVPKGWKFPANCTCKTLFDFWYHGIFSEGIRPLKRLSRRFDIAAADMMQFSRAATVMTIIEKIILSPTHHLMPQGKTNINDITIVEGDAAFNEAYKLLISVLYSGKKSYREEQISYGRIYNLICQSRERIEQELGIKTK